MAKKNKRENVSNLNTKSNLSYEQYLKSAFQLISPNLSIRAYKLASKDDYPGFERGRDLRIQIYWKKESKHEFLVEQSFFYQSNRNKEDRRWMRGWADPKIKMIKDAMIKTPKKKAKSVVNKRHKKLNSKIGSTQDVFEKMKSK